VISSFDCLIFITFSLISFLKKLVYYGAQKLNAPIYKFLIKYSKSFLL